MKNRLIYKILLIFSVIVFAILVRLFISNKDAVIGFILHKNRPVQAATVVVDTIDEEDVVPSFEAPGRVVSKYQVSIMARISGYLQKSFFKEGDYVKAGGISECF